ncbi:putative transcriptional regulatory protein-like protein [Hapsidospora chrysogenum ATCC 11550]|uniref:Putative transcriptional regulatory protein-like protein n=1 Tax=Hapsidospora chrysogenum (strain ATCC 11550 / CBS 779.69 / DSM 880 / IAM 14645 / JCM 23072 / IMI 49137) TaxID=857340 RepID=A0A086T9R4_HAPC1|nr:putative transcriptional regulatory protein-like protein [Hapsidospora chrysogenum ATCC 11550]
MLQIADSMESNAESPASPTRAERGYLWRPSRALQHHGQIAITYSRPLSPGSSPSWIRLLRTRLAAVGLDKLLPFLLPPQNNHQLSFQNFPEIRVYKASDMWNQGSTLPCLGISPQLPAGPVMTNTAQHELPPLVEILPELDNYFENYNCFIPLFDRATFMHMVIDWYSSPAKKSLIPWSAINIVLAISYRVLDDLPIDDTRLAQCIRNVQSVTTELMAWNEDLLGLQVLLGMVILFQGTTNPQLAIVLIGSAIRLAQNMGLPSRNANANLPPDASLQRRRIFWIAYILDRDLSLRAKAPYTQLDAETDLELPEQDDQDGIGILTSDTDHVQFDYLRARAELAVIQGKVHNLLYSRTAHRLNKEQRSETLSRIERMLSDWRNGIPAELMHSDGLFRRFSRMPIQLMMNMYNRHLECLYRINGVFAFDEAWISRVRSYLSATVIELGEDGIDGEVNHSEIAPLPGEWAQCVQHCRLGFELSAFGRETEYSVCLIILLVNIIEFPDHQLVGSDWDLISRMREMFEQMNAKASQEPFFLLAMAQELGRRAWGQVKRITHLRTMEFHEVTEPDSTMAENWMSLDLMHT